MSFLRTLSRRHSWLAALLLALSLAAHGVVPVGYMPDAANGAFSITLCSNYAPFLAAAHSHHHHHRDGEHSKHQSSQPCAFAGLAAPALLNAAVAVPLPAFALSQQFTERPVAERLVLEPPPRPPSRGPPILT